MSKNLVQLAQFLSEESNNEAYKVILALAKSELAEAERLLRQLVLVTESALASKHPEDVEIMFAIDDNTLIDNVLRGTVVRRYDQEDVEVDMSHIKVDRIYYDNPDA